VCVQAAGSVPGVEGIHTAPTGGGLLSGAGPYSRSAAHAHAC